MSPQRCSVRLRRKMHVTHTKYTYGQTHNSTEPSARPATVTPNTDITDTSKFACTRFITAFLKTRVRAICIFCAFSTRLRLLHILTTSNARRAPKLSKKGVVARVSPLCACVCAESRGKSIQNTPSASHQAPVLQHSHCLMHTVTGTAFGTTERTYIRAHRTLHDTYTRDSIAVQTFARQQRF